MGDKFLGVDIAGEIHKALSPGLYDAVLTRRTAGARTTSNLAGGTNPTETTFTARGFVDTYEESEIDGEIIKRGDRIVVLIGDSISGGAVPQANDTVAIEGGTYRVVAVDRDPAKATYECQARRA